MDIRRKLELVSDSIRSISEHRDVDSVVRLAALDRVASIIASEREKVQAEVAAETAAHIGE